MSLVPANPGPHWRRLSTGSSALTHVIEGASGLLWRWVGADDPWCPVVADGRWEGPARPSVQEQPEPATGDGPAVWDLVVADMHARDALGRERYGTRLQPHNGRDALLDAYQEMLDAAVYLRTAIYERDGR